MSNSKNTKCIVEKVVLSVETCMQANKLDGWPASCFLTLLICLQCSDNDFGGGDVSRDVLLESGLFKIVVGYAKRYKNSIGGHECVAFWYDQS